MFSTKLALVAMCVAVLSLSLAQGQQLLSKSQYILLKSNITEMLRQDSSLLPRMVQMTFHDCIGGCDGCLDPAQPNNDNLGPVVALAQTFRNQFLSQLSQADVNVLLGKLALEFAATLAGGNLRIPYSIGRQDCDRTNGFPQRIFAFGEETNSLRFLQFMFGLSPKESVALLGVHTLGRTNGHVSGFDGPWDDTIHALDSKYFTNMIESGWEIERRHSIPQVNSCQWTKNAGSEDDKTMMLNADMIAYKNFTTGRFDRPSCEFDDCPLSSTASYVSEFAENQNKFHKTLERAFTKMIDQNNPNLSRVWP